MDLSFQVPALALAAAGLPPLALAVKAVLGPRLPGRARSHLAAAVLASLLLASLARPVSRARALEPGAAVLLIDVSGSVPPEERARALEQARALSASLAAAGTPVSVLAFDAEPRRWDDLGGDPPAGVRAPGEGPGRRSAAGSRFFPALQAAWGLLPERGNGLVVVFSDGRFPDGDEPPAPRPGVRIFAVPLRPRGTASVEILSLDVERPLERGAPATASVGVRASAAGAGEALLRVDGEVAAVRPLALAPGREARAVFSGLDLPEGEHRISASFRGSGGSLPDAGPASVGVRVEGPPRVLVVDRTPPRGLALLRALEAQQADLTAMEWEKAADSATPLEAFDAVVLVEPPDPAALADLPARLARYASQGGGLLVVAGRDGFGPGWRGGPLAAALPAAPRDPPPVASPEKKADEPPPGESPPVTPPAPETPPPPESDPPRAPRTVEVGDVALVFLIDKSGSMVGRKIRLAKEAAIAAASELGSPNRVGVIAFDTEASWVVEMTDAGRRDWIADRVSRLVAGGGTNIFPALVKAHNALKDLPARIRHVILISDGYNRTLEDFQGIVTRMAASGVSLSTIGVGEQFDTRLLSSLTFWAGRERGRFDFAQDFSRIPRLVVDQTRWALGKPDAAADRQKPPDRPAEPPPPPTEPPRPDPAPEPPSEPPPPPPRVPVRVRISHPNPPFRGLSDPDVPPLFGYRRASPAAVADTLAEMPDGTPLVVSGEHGLGRVLYVGTSFDEEWGSDWRAWPRFPAWLGQAVRWIKRRPEGPLPPRVSFSRSPARGLEAEILADPGSAAPEEPPLAVWAGPDAGPPLPALRTGTHRFLVRFPEGARAPGGALKIRFPPGSGSESAEVEVPVPVEVPWESSFFEPDRDRLESIVRPAGGGILDDPARLPAPPPSLREETRAWGWLPLACAAPWLAVLVLLRRLEKRAVR